MDHCRSSSVAQDCWRINWLIHLKNVSHRKLSLFILSYVRPSWSIVVGWICRYIHICWFIDSVCFDVSNTKIHHTQTHAHTCTDIQHLFCILNETGLWSLSFPSSRCQCFCFEDVHDVWIQEDIFFLFIITFNDNCCSPKVSRSLKMMIVVAAAIQPVCWLYHSYFVCIRMKL